MKVQIDITSKVKVESNNPAVQVVSGSETESKTSIIMTETGVVVGTETVETEAGTFEECLKIEFHLETKRKIDDVPKEAKQQLSIVTTVWLAPKLESSKLHEKTNKPRK